MWNISTSILTDSLIQLSTPLSTHALCVGKKVMIIDAGPLFSSSLLIEQFESVGHHLQGIDAVFLTHAAWDHVGGIVSLRQRFPDLKVYASKKTAERIIQNGKSYFQYEVEAYRATGKQVPLSEEEYLNYLKIDLFFSDGETFDLGGGESLLVCAFPGYQTDLHGFFLLPDRAMIAAEISGFYRGRDTSTLAKIDHLDDMLDSLSKISSREMNYLFLPHSGVLSGDLIQRHLIELQEYPEKQFSRIKELIATGLQEEEVEILFYQDWSEKGIAPMGPFARENIDCIKRLVSLALEG